MKINSLITIVAVISLLFLGVACANPTPTLIAIPTITYAPPPIPPATSAPTRAQTAQPVTVAPKPGTTVAPSLAPTSANAPRIISFTAVPTTTQTLGEKISATWEAKGTQATLCPFIIGPSGPVEQSKACSDVPLAGNKTITIDQDALDWSGLQLRVTTGQTIERAQVFLRIGCKGFIDWFFANAPDACPQAAAINSSAAAQHFEHGLMVWTKQPDKFYIFYNNDNPQVFEWTDAPYTFTPGASPNNRVSEKPPARLYEPVSGFGQLWRGEFQFIQGVRQRLGWATDQEFNFNTSYQCQRTSPLFRLWTCFLRSPDGQVLRLRPDSTAQVHFIWEVVAP